MDGIEVISKYFPNLTERQTEQFVSLGNLYNEWNQKINVISRKDIDNLYLHHILHSLAIAKAVTFREGTHVLDLGTGGGFPGLPLAIMFPKCKFRLIDGTRKKINVVTDIAHSIGLENTEAAHLRGEEEKGKFDFIVSRAVMPFPDLVKLVTNNVGRSQKNALLNGILCLKGGNLDEETMPFKRLLKKTELTNWFDEDWFKDKYLLYLAV